MELVASAKGMLMVSRRRTPAIHGLGPRQLQWCTQRWPSFADRRVVQRNHEIASAAYRIAGLIEEARDHMGRTV
jgi:hypothetical protein